MKKNNNGMRKSVVWAVALVVMGLSGLTDQAAGQARSGPMVSKGGAEPAAKDTGVIECSGKLAPRQRFTASLRPGETVSAAMVQEGALVVAGAPLVQLANETLMGQLAVLREKKQAVDQDADRHEILKVRVAVAQQAVQRQDAQIAKEHQIREKVPDYQVEAKVQTWTEAKLNKQGELDVLLKELSLFDARAEDSARYRAFIEERLAAAQQDIDRLLVKAPFGGHVVKMRPYPERLGPGELVIEVWDDSVLQVEASVAQHQLKHVQPGSKVQVFPNFDEAYFVSGTVRSINVASETMQEDRFPQFPMIVDLDEAIAGGRAGTAVAVRIVGPEAAAGK